MHNLTSDSVDTIWVENDFASIELCQGDAWRHKFVSKCAQIAPNHLRTRAQKALDLFKIINMTEKWAKIAAKYQFKKFSFVSNSTLFCGRIDPDFLKRILESEFQDPNFRVFFYTCADMLICQVDLTKLEEL